MESDFQRYYDMDLNAEVFDRDMGVRRFYVLVRGLPYDSSFQAFLRDKSNRDAASWGNQKLKKLR